MTSQSPSTLLIHRLVLALVVLVDLLSFPLFIGDARSTALAAGRDLETLLRHSSSLPLVWAVSGCGIVGVIAFARRAGGIASGLVALVALGLLSSIHARLFGSPWRHLYFSGVCLAGWLLGLWVARQRGSEEKESFARIGSIALLGAAYFNSGLSKMIYGGPEWLSGHTIQFVVLGQDGLVADDLLSSFRSWVANTPKVAMIFSISTVGFEVAGPLMLVGRKTRALVALGLIGMHTLIYLLTHIIYWESMVLLALLGLSRDTPAAEGTGDPVFPTLFRDRRFVVITAFLVMCAILAVGHQRQRFAASQASRGVASDDALRPISHSGETVRSGPPGKDSALVEDVAAINAVGPLRVGDHIGSDWTVRSFRLGDSGFELQLSSATGDTRFEITCAESTYDSPFDLAAAHIFYSNDRPFADIEALGWALRERIQESAVLPICEQITGWVKAARGQSESQTPLAP